MATAGAQPPQVNVPGGEREPIDLGAYRKGKQEDNKQGGRRWPWVVGASALVAGIGTGAVVLHNHLTSRSRSADTGKTGSTSSSADQLKKQQELEQIKATLLTPGYHTGVTLPDGSVHTYYTFQHPDNAPITDVKVLEVPDWNNYQMTTKEYKAADGTMQTRLVYTDSENHVKGYFKPNVVVLNSLGESSKIAMQGAVVDADPKDAANIQTANAKSFDSFKFVLPMGFADVPETDTVAVEFYNSGGAGMTTLDVYVMQGLNGQLPNSDQTWKTPNYDIPVYSLFNGQLMVTRSGVSVVPPFNGKVLTEIANPESLYLGFGNEPINTVSSAERHFLIGGTLTPTGAVSAQTPENLTAGTQVANFNTTGKDGNGKPTAGRIRFEMTDVAGSLPLDGSHLASVDAQQSGGMATIPGIDGLSITESSSLLTA